MANSKESFVPEEMIISGNGNESGNGGDANMAGAENATYKRLAVARGTQVPNKELLERYDSLLEAYAGKLENVIQHQARKASTGVTGDAGAGIELGEVISGGGYGPYYKGYYKWWDVFVVGPIQNISHPPFLPHKIISGGEYAFFFVFVVKNPLPTPGGGPSALTLLQCRKFQLNAELMNLTNVTNGPDIQINSEFNGRVVQPYLMVFRAPYPKDGKPDLYEINVTADVTDCPQPFAAFATRILDIDRDPDGLPFPLDARKGPHVHDEQPMRFLVYRK